MEGNSSPPGGKVYTAGFAANLDSPKPIFWILVILLSFVLPPLGILGAGFFLFKAFKNKHKKLYLMALAALVAALVGILGVSAARGILADLKVDRYKYSKLDDYKLSGNSEGIGIAFKKPLEFKEKNKDIQLDSGKSFATLYDEDTKNKAFGAVNANITNSALAKAEGYPETLGKDLETKTGRYANFEEISKRYLKSFLPKGVEITMSEPTPFKNSSISKNAWLFTFVASGKIDGSQSTTVIKGISILAIGKQSFYNFSLASADENWSYNKTTWQQVTDSIKIDQ